MGEYAEYTAEKAGVTREDQDAFAYDSHRKAIAATEAGKFKAEILPVQIPGKAGPTSISADESPRKDTSPATLAKLKPAFRKDGGTVTAGNAPGLNDGSSALVVTSLAFAKAHGLSPMAKVTGYATGGVEPREIFFAPVYAVRSLME
jgi:acetyl-CoA C-acetyltransferase